MDACPSRKVESDQAPAAPSPFPAGRADIRELLGGRSELIIEHNGREYRLRLTQSGKLILTA